MSKNAVYSSPPWPWTARTSTPWTSTGGWKVRMSKILKLILDHFVQFRNDDYCVVYCYVFSISDHLSGTLWDVWSHLTQLMTSCSEERRVSFRVSMAVWSSSWQSLFARTTAWRKVQCALCIKYCRTRYDLLSSPWVLEILLCTGRQSPDAQSESCTGNGFFIMSWTWMWIPSRKTHPAHNLMPRSHW